ncbi:alpha/beta fold hydrolase [Dietzia maris]
MSYLAVEGENRVYFEHHTTGGTQTIVLAHGWGMSGRVWDYVIPQLLENKIDVVTVDARACGQSDKDFNDVSIAALGSDIVSVVDHLGLDRVVLNGWSLGGAVVVDAAAKLGNKLEGLVLTGGATPRYTNTDDWTSGIPAEGMPDMMAAMNDDRVTFLRNLAGAQCHVDVGQPVIEWMWGIFNQSGVRSNVTMGELEVIDQRALVEKITAPVLVVGGKHDQTVPFTIAQNQAEAFQNARLVAMETGHVPFIEAREDYRSELLGFLAQVRT